MQYFQDPEIHLIFQNNYRYYVLFCSILFNYCIDFGGDRFLNFSSRIAISFWRKFITRTVCESVQKSIYSFHLIFNTISAYEMLKKYVDISRARIFIVVLLRVKSLYVFMPTRHILNFSFRCDPLLSLSIVLSCVILIEYSNNIHLEYVL